MSDKWHRRLEGDLFVKHPRENIETPKILINMVSDGRYYTLFNSIEKLETFLSTIPEEKQTFFEVILGENRQKPRFDIDDIHVELVPEMFDAFGSLFKKFNIGPECLLWYSSSNQSKQSYHLILPDYYFETSFEAKKLWYYVQENIDPRFATYIDSRVYSITQCFRLLGSQKQGSGRPKRLMKSWNYQNEIIEQKGNLRDSLVGYVEDQKLFPAFEIKEKITSSTRGELTGDIQEYLNIINQYIGHEFDFWMVKNGVIFYNRIAPSFCEICKKKHDSVGAYFTIHKDSIIHHCYRAETYNGESIFISKCGILGLEDYKQPSVFKEKTMSDKVLELLIEELSNEKIRENKKIRLDIIHMVKDKLKDNNFKEVINAWYKHMNKHIDNYDEYLNEENNIKWGKIKEYVEKWGNGKIIMGDFDGRKKENKIKKSVGTDNEEKCDRIPDQIRRFDSASLGFLLQGLDHANRIVEELKGYFIYNSQLFYFDSKTKLYQSGRDEILKEIIAVKTKEIVIKAMITQQIYMKNNPDHKIKDKNIINEEDYKHYWELKTVNNILSFVRKPLVLREKDYHKLNRENGFLPIVGGKKIDLETFEIIERTEKDLWTFESPIEEHNDRNIDEQVKEFVMKIFFSSPNDFEKFCSLGYKTVMGPLEPAELFVLFVGNPSSGKNTLMMMLMKILCDELAIKEPIDQIKKNTHSVEGPNHHGGRTIELMAKRQIWYDEPDEGFRADEKKIQDQSNQDTSMSGRKTGLLGYLYGVIKFVQWITLNYTIPFKDIATRRRLRLIVATGSFVDRNEDPERGIFLKMNGAEKRKFFSPQYLFSFLRIMKENYKLENCSGNDEDADFVLNETTEIFVEKEKIVVEKWKGEIFFKKWFDETYDLDLNFDDKNLIPTSDIWDKLETDFKGKLGTTKIAFSRYIKSYLAEKNEKINKIKSGKSYYHLILKVKPKKEETEGKISL